MARVRSAAMAATKTEFKRGTRIVLGLRDVMDDPDQLAPEELQTRFHELLSAAFDAGATERRMRIRRETWSRSPMFKKGRAR